MKGRWCVFVLGIALGLFGLPSVASADYAITDLGVLATGGSTKGFGLNNLGVVIGTGTTSSSNSVAFSYSGGLQPLGSVNGWPNSFGQSINDIGQATGYLTRGSGITAQANVFFKDPSGAMVDLATVLGMTGNSHGYAINKSGLITGDYTNGGALNAFVTAPGGGFQNLGTLGGLTSSGFAINSSGQVAGVSSIDMQGTEVAFYTDGNHVMHSLGFLQGGSFSTAQGINDAGHVTGFGTTTGGFNQAFFWSGSGTLQTLGNLAGGSSSLGLAINNGDVVVGEADVAGNVFHAFIWNAKDGMQDLNALAPIAGWQQLTAALGVNDFGQITGYGITSSGETHGFLLTPSGIVVPAPPAVLLLGIGGLTMAIHRGVRRVRDARTDCPERDESAAASRGC
jgi:probable HAF family extracellular repeat protein